MEMKQLSPKLSVGAQIASGDLKALAGEGFTDVVCNRPDEEHLEDPAWTTLAERAEKLGLQFHYLPIVPGEPIVRQSRRLAEIVARPGARVFAYCRSGARASNAWTHAQEERAVKTLQTSKIGACGIAV